MLIKLSFIFFVIGLSSITFAQRFPPFPRPPFCGSASSWKTVDSISSLGGETALLAGVATYKNFAYAVGFAELVEGAGSWVIRRSTDYGETWRTAKLLPGGGRGIAVDPRNGHLYSIGALGYPSPEREHLWVVQKSTDNGLSWRQVDDFYNRDTTYFSGRVTVDGRGHVIVVGQESHREKLTPIIRRSEDGGLTWKNYFYTSKNFIANQVAASHDGKVIIVGALTTPNYESIGSKWTVFYSPDGKSHWKEVDAFAGSSSDPSVGSHAAGVSIHPSGRVVVAGSIGKDFEGPYRILVRQSNLSAITSWSSVMAYQPFIPRLGVGSASAAHIVFMNPRRFLINGRERQPRSVIDSNLALDKRIPFIVRKSDRVWNPFTSPFQHEYIYTGGLAKLSNGTALSGYVQDNEKSKSWFIRKMTCPLK